MLINNALGAQWHVGRLSTSYVELAVVDAENKPIFGQSVSLYYEKKCWLGGERFQINVGTCGSHDLFPEEHGYTMADFYIGIGKLHANTELLETIKDALFYYAERRGESRRLYPQRRQGVRRDCINYACRNILRNADTAQVIAGCCR